MPPGLHGLWNRDFRSRGAAGAAEFHARFDEELAGEVEDIFPLPERRQSDHEFIQAIVDVLTEAARPHLTFQADIRRGDDPRVHSNRSGAAERLHLSFLQGPQALDLGRERMIGDFIEEEASPVSERALPFLPLIRSGECALFMTEQLRIDQRIRKRPAVDRHGSFS